MGHLIPAGTGFPIHRQLRVAATGIFEEGTPEAQAAGADEEQVV